MGIELTGKRVLLTGGTGGIGRTLAHAIARAGAGLVTCGRSNTEAAETLSRELGDGHHVLLSDVSREDQVQNLVDECGKRLGGLDVVITNAGAISHIPFGELSPVDWHRVVDTNLTSAYLIVSKALPFLSEGASIVFLGSRAASAGIPLRAHYTASKAALVGLARSLARELGPRRIRVNVVAPGVVETAERPLPEATRKRYHEKTALGRLGVPEEIANAVLFLASDLASYVTGETLNVDGGI